MSTKQVSYQPQHISRSITENLQTITFSVYNVEHTITGVVEEIENYIYLYEYRGKQTGTEFFISFSKDSTSYKLINAKALGL